jgi:transposase
VPKQNSTGGKERRVGLQPTGLSRGGITKTGDRHLRQLLVVAATGLVHRGRAKPETAPWFAGLLARMPAKKAAMALAGAGYALANKMARIAWAMLVKQTAYRAPAPKPAAPAAL